MRDQQMEQQIQAVGANVAPRITPADIEAEIYSEHYFTAEEGVWGAYKRNDDVHHGNTIQKIAAETLPLLTFCVLVLRNGFTVTGESACASPENFNADIGRRIARENAVNKIWPLMGYQLKEQLQSQ